MSLTAQKTGIPVWDPLVRYGHWALAVAFAIAWISGNDEAGDPSQLHVLAGYVVGIIVAVRVFWGLVGTRHARFIDFAYGPGTALRYLGDLPRGRGRRYIGHSPAAAYMIVALLVCLTATVWTGLAAYGVSGHGPLTRGPSAVITVAHAEEREGHAEGGGRLREGEGGIAGDLHGTLANITIYSLVIEVGRETGPCGRR